VFLFFMLQLGRRNCQHKYLRSELYFHTSTKQYTVIYAQHTTDVTASASSFFGFISHTDVLVALEKMFIK